MDAMLQWGVDFVRSVQVIRFPLLDTIITIITHLGSELAYILILSFIFWCIDEKRAFKLAFLVLFSAWINSSIKELFKQPRPYDLDPSVGIVREHSYGLPSGHSQHSLVFWGVLGSWLKKPAGLIVAISIPLLIAFSRIYLGVHFPTDVLGGWLIGGLLLSGWFILSDRLELFIKTLNVRIQILAIVALVFIMNALHPQDISMGALLFGISMGYILMRSKFSFNAACAAKGSDKPSIFIKLLRVLIGLTLLLGVFFSLKLISPEKGSEWYDLFRFIRYALTGFQVSAVAPFLFKKLSLA